MNHPDDERSPWAVLAEWTARLTNIALEMALPALGGFGLDRWLGTMPIFLVVGSLLGFAVGMTHLLRLAKSDSSRR